MNREDRVALIDRMLEARSEQEIEAAQKDAEGRLKENPKDVRVIAASERLDKTNARVRDPEHGANRLALFVFTLVALAAGALTDSLYAALAVGVLITLPLTEFVWELLHGRSVDAAGRDGER